MLFTIFKNEKMKFSHLPNYWGKSWMDGTLGINYDVLHRPRKHKFEKNMSMYKVEILKQFLIRNKVDWATDKKNKAIVFWVDSTKIDEQAKPRMIEVTVKGLPVPTPLPGGFFNIEDMQASSVEWFEA